MRQNLAGTAAPGGLSYVTEASTSFGCGENNPISTGQPVEQPSMHQGAMNSIQAKDAAGNMRAKIGTNSGPGGSTFMTESFEPAAGMDSFGKSLNPVLELHGNAGPGCTSY